VPGGDAPDGGWLAIFRPPRSPTPSLFYKERKRVRLFQMGCGGILLASEVVVVDAEVLDSDPHMIEVVSKEMNGLRWIWSRSGSNEIDGKG